MNIGSLIATLGVNTVGLYQAEKKMQEFEATANATFTRIEASSKRLGASFKTIGSNLNRYVTLPIVALGAGSFITFKKFEYELAKINGLVGVAKDKVDVWEKQILKLGPVVGEGPTKLAKAMFFITSAGLRGQHAMNVLKYSAEAAQAGLGDVKTVADLATSAMNAYGAANLKAKQAVSTLVATVREGKAEPQELAASMGMVLPIASAMGVKFNQVGAAMAAMTRTGTHASTAAMELRQILAAFLKPTTKSEQVLESMGTSFAKVQNGFKEMGTSAEHFREVIKDKGLLAALLELRKLSEKYGTTIMSKVFPNIRALTGVLSLVGSNLQNTIGIFKRMSDNTGTLDRAFAAVANTVQHKWNVAVAGMQTALTKLGQVTSKALIPIITKFSKLIQSIANWFTGLSASTQHFIIIAVGITAVLGPILTVLGFLTTSVLPGLLMIGSKLVKMFDALKLAILTDPLTAWIAVAGIAATVIYTFWNNTKKASIAQKSLNDEFERAKNLTEATNSLKSYVNVLSSMNKEQILALKNKIVTQIKKETNLHIKELAVRKEALQKVADYEKKLDSERYNRIVYTTDKIQKQVVKTQQETSNKQKQIEIKTYNQRIKELQDFLKKVDERLKDFHKTPKTITIHGAVLDVAQGKIYDQLQQKLKILTNTEKAYGNQVNLTKQRINAYKDAIGSLLQSGIEPNNRILQELISKQKQLIKQYEESTSPLNVLSIQLAHINAISILLGKGFDSTQLKLQLFNNALEQGIKTGQLTAASYKYLKEQIKQLQAQLQSQDIGKIFANIPEQLKLAKRNVKLFGNSFNFVNAQIQIYSNALQQLENYKGIFTPQQITLIKQYSEKLSQLQGTMKQYNQTTAMINQMSSAFNSLGASIGGMAGSWLQWIANVLNKLPVIIRMIKLLGLMHKAAALQTTLHTAATMGNTAANIANAASANVQSAADSGAAVSKAVKSGAGQPFPMNLIAIVMGVAAVIAALSSIPKAKAKARMANGGIVPDGFSNDSFPAMLQSREVVIPLKKLPELLNLNKNTGTKEVVLHIQGRELVGVLKEEDLFMENF